MTRVASSEAVRLSAAQFAALGRLAGTEPLLDGWVPQLNVAGWFAVTDSLAARGLLISRDGGATYRATAAGGLLVDPIADADRAWSASIEAEGRVLGRMVIGTDRALVRVDATSDDGTLLEPIAADAVAEFLLEAVGLQGAALESAEIAEHQIAQEKLVEALAGAEPDGPVSESLAEFVRALSAATMHVRFERRLLTPVGVVVDHCTWFDSGAFGCWRVHPSGETISVGRCTLGQLRAVVVDLLDC